MPNPKKLKVGDKVRFVEMPGSWSKHGTVVHRETKRFMRFMLKRKTPLVISEIDEHGPWVQARIHTKGKYESHYWCMDNDTGWVKIDSHI